MPSTTPKQGQSLADLMPNLAKEWHPTKNETLKPSDVRLGSHKKVWWQCSKGHEWQAIIKNRSNGHGCPVCHGLLTAIRNTTPKANESLMELRPDLASEWHPSKNGDLKPSDVKPGSNKKVWWQCSKGHEWKTQILTRSKGCGCPYCSSKKVFVGENDLATVNPQLATEWHPAKNGDLKPSGVTVGSSRKVWWQCAKGHEWQAVVRDRNNGVGCPFCSNKKTFSGENDLATVNPQVALEWHPTKNGNLTPSHVTAGSNLTVWWQCSKGHEWQASINNRNKRSGCPYCSNKKVLVGENDLVTINPQIAAEWHPSKNGNLKPSEYTAKSGKKVWWQCAKGHEWQATINNRSKGAGCPYCSNKMVLPGENDLASVNPQLAAEWHQLKNGDLKPSDIVSGSNKKVWWQCAKGHEWQATVYDRNHGTGCPYCSNKRIIRGENDLATVNPKLASEWHPTKNGDLTPSDVTVGSSKKVWWQCPKGHEWQTTPSERTRGSGCPFCSSMGTSYPEQFIYWSLKQLFPDTINRFRTSTNVEYDIFIPSIKLAIEYSGTYWHSGKEHKDLYKKQLAAEQNVSFFEIIEDRKTLSCDGIIVQNKSDQELMIIINHILSGYDQTSIIDYQYSHDMAIEYSTGKIEYEKSLEYSSPQLAAEWHPTKNGAVKPSDVKPGSNIIVWWKCSKGHEWQAEILNRSYGSGCPFCNSKKIVQGENDLVTENPKLALEWHPTKNGDLKPSDVMAGSNKKAWWRCSNGHEWQALINNRSRGSGCPYCTGSKVLLGENDLSTVNPRLASEWHPTKNGTLKPSAFTANSGKKVWWKCSKGHEWQATINDRSNGIGCPYCSNKKAFPGENDLATVNPLLASEWHPTKNGNLTPADVVAGSHKKVWWKCSKGHEWQAMVNTRSSGSGCPYCSNRKIAQGENDLATVNPLLASEWHPTKNGNLTPADVTAGSGKKVWWQCSNGHEWLAIVGKRSRGSGCPKCNVSGRNPNKRQSLLTNKE